MTKLLLATLIVLGAASVNAAPCNPETAADGCVQYKGQPYTGPAFVPTAGGICNPEQTTCVVVVKSGPADWAWLAKVEAYFKSIGATKTDAFVEHGN